MGHFNRTVLSDRFGFKFSMIDSQEASTEVTLFNRKFRTPVFSGALSGMTDIVDKPLKEIALGVKQRLNDVGRDRLVGSG